MARFTREDELPRKGESRRPPELGNVVDLKRRRVLGDRQASAMVVRQLLARAALAREDIGSFFEFVMREETTRAALKLAPHQRVALDFILAHERSVNIWPIGTSKSFCMACLTLWFLGHDRTTRGAIVSKAQGQAQKVLRMVADYILSSPELRLVFPELRASLRSHEPWTQTAIIVDRPAGIRDASLVALGQGGSIAGSRLNWIIIDDLADLENCGTREQRDKLYTWLDSEVLSRLDPRGSRVVFTNTARHPEDPMHELVRRAGWAMMRMDIMGGIYVQDDAMSLAAGEEPWDHPGIRPATSNPSDEECRLVAHDPDPGNVMPLWPARWSLEKIEQERRTKLPHVFNQVFMGICRDDETSMCKIEWVETCKQAAIEMRHHSMTSAYAGPNLVFMGVDLAFRKGESADYTALFAFEQLEDGRRKILHVDFGQWDAPTVCDKIVAACAALRVAAVRVENNGCFVPGTNVLTIGGYVPIEKIRVGDLVLTHMGRWRKVTNLLTATSKGLVDVRVSGSVPVRATPNHCFWMREAGRSPGRKGGHHRPIGEPAWISCGVADRPAYVGVPVGSWPDKDPVLDLMDRRRGSVRVEVDEGVAMLLGLYMAEGHTSRSSVFFTLNFREDHLAWLVSEQLGKLGGANLRLHRSPERGVLRAVFSHAGFTWVTRRFGVSSAKCPPMDWMGWPVEIRLAMVRGWLLGDGCILTNNAKTPWPREHFAGSTISRNWALFARQTLLQAGYRATMSIGDSRGSGFIEGRRISRRPVYSLNLNHEDSYRLREQMTASVEQDHWKSIRHGGRASNSSSVLEDGVMWSRLRPNILDSHAPHGDVVHNLEVEEDHSFVVEDMAVHNAQEGLLQFLRKRDASVPLKAHTTGLNKANPTYGVQGVFIDMMNGAWVIPCDASGVCHPAIQRFVDESLYYTPDAHTGDVLMAAWMAREMAREWGLLDGGSGRVSDGALGMNILAR